MCRRLVPAPLIGAALTALLAASCTAPRELRSAVDAEPGESVARQTLTVDDGVSGVFEFHVPVGTTAISVLATSSNPDALVQLGSLTLAGDTLYEAERDDVSHMVTRLRDREVITYPSGFVQEVQRGSFAFTYPFAPGWNLPAGPAAISFLTNADATLDVEILTLGPAARTRMNVTVFAPGERTLSEDARREVGTIFDQAGIAVAWGDRTLPAWVPGSLTDLDPAGGSYRLLTDTVASRSTGSVNVVIVDALPGGVSGVSTGIPGHHDGTGTAITVTFRDAGETARLVAHEIGHLLGLRHLEDRSATGVVVENPIADTRADAFNLMQFGTNLTDGQIEVLRLSPLLGVPDGSRG